MKKLFVFIFLIMLVMLIVLTGCTRENNISEDDKFKIVTSFYPMYVIALNITEGIEDVSVNNMTSDSVGCLHNYTLQASDLKKLSKADMFIMNGLGIETFVDKIKGEFPNLEQIDTSTTQLDLIKDSHGINGHVWNSIDNYIAQVEVVLNSLCAENPENTAKYTDNAEKYMAKLNKLKQNSYIAKGGTTVVSCNESLAYLLNDTSIKFIEVYSDHEQSALSSEKLSSVIDEMKQKNVKTIFIAKGDNRKTAELIAQETGAQIYELDAHLTGEMNKDSYINTMTSNYNILKDCLE